MTVLRSATVAALLVLTIAATSSPVLASGVDPGAATPVQREQAQSRFNKGRKEYGAARYTDAITEFRASHEIVASPNARLYLARALRGAGQLVEAYVEFGRTEVEAKELEKADSRYRKAYTAAAAERKAIAPKLAFVTVTVEHATPETTLTVAGQQIRRAGWSEAAPVAPGLTEVVVETPGRLPVSQKLTLAAAERREITLDATSSPSAVAEKAAPPPAAPTPATRSPLRTYAYVAAGVGAAGLVTFTVAGLLSNGTYSDLETACGDARCPPSRAEDVDSGRTQQAVANVGLVIGLLGAGAAVTLFVLGAPRHGEARAQAVVGPSFSGIRGSF